MGHSLGSSIGELPARGEPLTLARTRAACGSAWGLVAGGQGADRGGAALPIAAKRNPSVRADAADLSSFSMSGFG